MKLGISPTLAFLKIQICVSLVRGSRGSPSQDLESDKTFPFLTLVSLYHLEHRHLSWGKERKRNGSNSRKEPPKSEVDMA